MELKSGVSCVRANSCWLPSGFIRCTHPRLARAWTSLVMQRCSCSSCQTCCCCPLTWLPLQSWWLHRPRAKQGADTCRCRMLGQQERAQQVRTPFSKRARVQSRGLTLNLPFLPAPSLSRLLCTTTGCQQDLCVVNPGRLAKGSSGGTYAYVTLVEGAGRVSQRCRVDIIRV